MKPNDDNAALPVNERPFRVLIISGSDRRQYNCPGVDSKSRTLMLQMAEMLPADWEIDYEDLGNVYSRARIQSCNACVSTSMALCVWPCNCYEKNSSSEPDLLWDLDMYARLDMADAWAIIGPINWYGPTSNLKLMFDRLVCMNGGNPDENTIEHKDPEKAMALEHTEQWQHMSQNHLEGRTAGFFCYGDEGADEMDATGRPKILRHKQYFDPEAEPFENERDAYAPFVWQCRYGGVEVPDKLWAHATTGKGQKYSDNQAEDMVQEDQFMQVFKQWVLEFTLFVAEKGKVPPNQYRAYGYQRPKNYLKELKTGIREWRLRFGLEPKNSSPQIQKELGLNQDTTLRPHKSEGEKLRE
ncbi:flavodoxin family protein [Adhaeribacter swui]|uniref:Flavodoxin family protein n=1 Tax=Adhaeribacter swui TaxID=2086471 RepID=A0A7G7GAD0_9BACT|nr:NAD(P)H-dependent oxidoreductase [Adhaeribacter swui]QNF34114.1 flavodoxin family protein [Adhaeribacter swui]